MRLVIGITGCSGIIYGTRLLKVCDELGIESDLIISPVAEKILDSEEDKRELQKSSTRAHDWSELGAPISSGSVSTDGMAIVPCSMKTLSSVANGIGDNLITRAANVTLKEGRKLVLVPRETPLHQIHLENMAKLSQAGATILPASPGFYHDPQSTEDLIDFIVGKILDQFEIEHQLYKPWKGPEG